MSLEYSSGADYSFPCTVCSSSMYIIKRGRMASWWECLRLQGYPVHRLDHLLLTQHQGMELAGNAFNGFVIPPLITAAFILDPGIAIASIELVLLSTQIIPTASLSLHPVSPDSEHECRSLVLEATKVRSLKSWISKIRLWMSLMSWLKVVAIPGLKSCTSFGANSNRCTC